LEVRRLPRQTEFRPLTGEVVMVRGEEIPGGLPLAARGKLR
jgi:hypothetical protein